MTTGSHSEMREFRKMLEARLARAQARMQQLEARAHARKMQPEIDALESARNLMRHIDQKRHSLEEATGRRAQEVRSEIEAANVRLESSIDQLALRLQAEAQGQIPGESHHSPSHAKPHAKDSQSDKRH